MTADPGGGAAGNGGTPPRVGVIVPAAGKGTRMGGRRKALLEAAGRPLLLHALDPFLEDPRVVSVVVVLAAEDAAEPPGWITGADPRVRVVEGGETRTASVRAGLEALPDEVDVVLVHDGARPLVAGEVVGRCIEVAAAGRGGVAGFPAVDTLKEVDGEGRVVRTAERELIWHAQTPQAFPRPLLARAYGEAEDADASDDAGLVERAGGEVVMVRSSRWNLKVTRPEDLEVVEALLGAAGRGR